MGISASLMIASWVVQSGSFRRPTSPHRPFESFRTNRPWRQEVTVGRHFYLRRLSTSHILLLPPHFQVGHSAQLATLPDRFSGAAAKRYPWWQAAVLMVLIGWLYSSILYHLIGQWWQDPNFSHGFFVPLFSAFVLWQDRSRLASLPVNPSWWGLLLVLGALFVLIVGVMGAELFLSRVSLLL